MLKLKIERWKIEDLELNKSYIHTGFKKEKPRFLEANPYEQKIYFIVFLLL
jgi:hypothetical protein